MAIGVFKLTKRQRITLSFIFVFLNIVQIVAGLMMIILSFYVYIAVAPILYSERAEITYVFIVVGICGTNNIFNYLFGIRICQKCIKQAYKKSTRTLLFVWSCMSFYIMFYLIILSMMTRKVYKHIIRSMNHSLHIGMTNYLKDSMWKLSIDNIQFDLQCCGITSFTEWHETDWLNKEQVNEKSDLVNQLRHGDHWNFPVTPWSCCRFDFPLQCLHDPLQQVRSTHIWTDQPSLVLESINTQGCLEKLKIPIQITLAAFIILVLVNCFVQILIFPISRILYTSCRNAILLNDTDGAVAGWIFGRGDCGYNRGKTLGQIMGFEFEITAKNSPLSKNPANEQEQEKN